MTAGHNQKRSLRDFALATVRLPLVVTLATGLHAGAAAFVQPARAASCAGFAAPLAARVAQSDVIVIGSVQSASGSAASVVPEAFLKGPARPEALSLRKPDQPPECPLADFTAGARVLVLVSARDGGYAWPDAAYAYVLKDGQARLATDQIADDRLESQLVSDIRSVTNLYAVPAKNGSDGASIDWVKTVVPVTIALVLVFAIGLWLMRIWHRIDPT